MDKKKDEVDYAAAYRHYIDFSEGRTLEGFCQDEGFGLENVYVFMSRDLRKIKVLSKGLRRFEQTLIRL